jgi:hypothetical protein
VKIQFNIIVFQGEDGGYRARADELGLISAPCRRRASAVKMLKEMLRAFMKAAAEQGTLTEQLDAVGFIWWMGADFIHVAVADSLRVKLPLPKDRRPGETTRKGSHAA